MFDYLVFIGRFQPYHRGHHHVALEALSKAKNLIFILGSHQKARSTRDPFYSNERIEIIKSCFSKKELERIHFGVQHDHTYNDDRWIASLQDIVYSIALGKRFHTGPINIGLVGHDKDHSTYYLHKFPQWDFVSVEPVEDFSATIFRKRWFTGALPMEDFISNEHMTTFFKYAEPNEEWLIDEFDFIRSYKNKWKDSPFPPTFNTVDAIVIQSGHVLLVQRRHSPGKGLWALPGGYLNQTETLKDAAIRELYEETRISVPKPIILGSITKEMTFDDPNRSQRGRTITHAYLVKLEDRGALPKIKGSSDAEKAFWLPFSEVRANRQMMYEDHYAIMEVMVGL